MQIIIDGVEHKSLANLLGQQLWIEIRKTVEQQKRIIQQVKVNGQILDETVNIPYDQVNRIEVETKSLFALIDETFQTASEYLPRLLEALQQSSEHFRAGEDGEAVKIFVTTQDGLNWNSQLLENSKVLLSQNSFISKLSEQNRSILSEMLEAWENEDFVSVADLIEYELVPNLQKWLDIIKKYKDESNT